MKKLLVFALCVILLTACRKENKNHYSANHPTDKTLQLVPKCGNELDAGFAAKMMKVRQSRDAQQKLSAKKPKQNPDQDPMPTVIFLDVDGHVLQNTIWNLFNSIEYESIDCPAAGLTEDQMNLIIKSVTEDFSPFKIKITADENLYNSAPKERRVRVIVTRYQGLDHIFPYSGGLAAIGSLLWKDDTPCFVFADVFFGNTNNIAEVVSHEAGHTIGLYHQSEFFEDGSLKYMYHSGFFLSDWAFYWKPIMGTSYYADISGWMNGETADHSRQHDIELLSVVGMDEDLAPATFPMAKELKLNGQAKQVSVKALINGYGDEDLYVVNSGKISFSVVGSGNCDMKVVAYNNRKQVLAEFNDPYSIDIAEKTINSKQDKIYLRLVANNLLPDQIQSAGQYTLVLKKYKNK